MTTSDDFLPATGRSLRNAFEALISTLNERDLSYALIGGVAVVQHARPRTTDDIDILLTVPQISLPGLFEALRERGFQVDPKKNIADFRDDGMTSVCFGDVSIDLLRPVIPAYERVIERTQVTEILGQRVRVCSPEGLVVTKLIAWRPQDEADIRDILTAYGDAVDLTFIRGELETFTRPDDPRRAKFESWAREAAERA